MSATVFPANTIVYIHETLGGVIVEASGVLIAPDEVLTAAHVVYDSAYGPATNIVVTPGFDGRSHVSSEVFPYGTAFGVSLRYNPIADAGGVISQADAALDYGVIHLDHAFTGLGAMPLQADFAGGEANISGYPLYQGGIQVTAAQNVSADPAAPLLLGVAPGAGAEGGPVWTYADGRAAIVGVVSSSDDATGQAIIAPISDAAYATITAWLAQDDPPCLLRGTRIATPSGMVAVESLRVGDLVRTRRGGTAAVRWLGWRHVACGRHPRPHDVWPVRVAAGAFGPGRPVRDVWLSPDHAVLCGGALIPVRYLLNGATVTQEPRAACDYWHVELPRHDVLSADGLAVESYLDTGNRGAFQNGGGVVALHPNFARRVWRDQGCAPLVRAGARLAAARRRLLARAVGLGHATTDDPGLIVLADDQPVPAETDGRGWWLRPPPGTRTLRLLSRTWVPAHMDADASDTRRLGLAVARLWLDGREVALDSPMLAQGWHTADGWRRWTDGDATIPVAGLRGVAFEVEPAGRYWLAPIAHPTQARA